MYRREGSEFIPPPFPVQLDWGFVYVFLKCHSRTSGGNRITTTPDNSQLPVGSLVLYTRVGWCLLVLAAHPSATDYLLSLVHKDSQGKNFEGQGQRSNFRATGIWARSSANNLRISENFENLKKSPFLSILDSPKYEFEIIVLVLSQNQLKDRDKKGKQFLTIIPRGKLIKKFLTFVNI